MKLILKIDLKRYDYLVQKRTDSSGYWLDGSKNCLWRFM